MSLKAVTSVWIWSSVQKMWPSSCVNEAAHAHQAVQRARGLVAMAGTEFAVAQRQLAVRAQAGVEDLDVARAVHRLDRVVAFLGRRGEHVVLVVLPVARLLPQRAVEHLRQRTSW